MPEPTNPKKRALMPSTPLRRALRATGHHLDPVVQVGKDGLTAGVVAQLDEALRRHELVKVKVGTESPEDRFELAAALPEAVEAQLAQVLGRTLLVYRRHPEKPRFEPLTPAEARARDEAAGARAAAREDASPARRRGGRRPVRRASAGKTGRMSKTGGTGRTGKTGKTGKTGRMSKTGRTGRTGRMGGADAAAGPRRPPRRRST